MDSAARAAHPLSVIGLWANPAELDFNSFLARSLHHQVQAFILKATHEGTLAPGDRLNESAISAQLGISRTPVREALTYLESTGLVVRRPRRGFFLAELDAREAQHYYEMREVLEAHAARNVAGRLTREQEQSLSHIVDAMGRAAAAGNWSQAAMHNIAFHETVVRLTGNPVLLRMWASVGPVLWYFDSVTSRTAKPADREAFLRRHRALLAALRSGDPGGAAAAFVSHIREVKKSIIQRLRSHDRTRGGKDDE
jgi:DNA-binding GntR family transcriptional regulator